MIYIPTSWWHQTVNLDVENIALMGRLVTPHNFKKVEHSFTGECMSDTLDISYIYEGASQQFHDDTCEALENCYRWWENRWGKNWIEEEAERRKQRNKKKKNKNKNEL